ncbi:MAG: MarP family serine protease [Acidimicrobiales bacterium]
MDVFDGVVILVAVLAGVGGYRLGFFTRALSWVGLAAGVYLAARYLPRLIAAVSVSSAAARLAVAAAVLIGAAFVGQAVGMVLGSRLHGVLPLGPLRTLDRVVGGAVGVLGVVTALWLLLPSISSVAGWPASVTSGSAIARWVSGTLPPPPNALEALRRLVVGDGLPQVFSSLHTTGPVGPPPARSPVPPAVLARVEASTVKVEGQACNRIQDGSGFAVGTDLVLTNAHVVAGEPPGETEVILPSGRVLAARVVLYDPSRDVALLSVPGLGERPLPLAGTAAGRDGDVLGHPGGQIALAVQPYSVAQEITAVGENLYDTHQTSRDVYVLSARLAPGDSGGPLVDPAGQVVGVAFAIAVGQTGTAYALTTAEITPDVRAPHAHAVSTRSCLTA